MFFFASKTHAHVGFFLIDMFVVYQPKNPILLNLNQKNGPYLRLPRDSSKLSRESHEMCHEGIPFPSRCGRIEDQAAVGPAGTNSLGPKKGEPCAEPYITCLSCTSTLAVPLGSPVYMKGLFFFRSLFQTLPNSFPLQKVLYI